MAFKIELLRDEEELAGIAHAVQTSVQFDCGVSGTCLRRDGRREMKA
jgi:hypothetical protein